MVDIVSANAIAGTRRIRTTNGYQLTLIEDWHVKTDVGSVGLETDPLFFVGDPLFPAIGAAHAQNSMLRFSTFSEAKPLESSKQWMFSGMQFGTWVQPITSTTGFSESRYDAPPSGTNSLNATRSWAFQSISEPLTRSLVADPTGASKLTRPVASGSFTEQQVATKYVGEPILGLSFDRYISVCTYTRNQTVVPTGLVTGALVGNVNTDAISIDGLTVPAQTCLLQDCTISDVKYSQDGGSNSIPFRTVTYQLAIDPRGWDIDVLHQGFYSMQSKPDTPATKKPGRIKVKDGWDSESKAAKTRNASTPQLLDENGEWIDTDPDVNDFATWSDKVHYRVFRNKSYVAFSGFGFS